MFAAPGINSLLWNVPQVQSVKEGLVTPLSHPPGTAPLGTSCLSGWCCSRQVSVPFLLQHCVMATSECFLVSKGLISLCSAAKAHTNIFFLGTSRSFVIGSYLCVRADGGSCVRSVPRVSRASESSEPLNVRGCFSCGTQGQWSRQASLSGRTGLTVALSRTPHLHLRVSLCAVVHCPLAAQNSHLTHFALGSLVSGQGKLTPRLCV